MEFWGVEVKAGQPLTVKPEFGKLVHISQASLGEFKNAKGAKNVRLRLKIGHEDLVIGFLSTEDRPQVMFDLVFQKDFELSHDWKEGSVYFIGYLADEPDSDDEEFSSEFEDDLVGAMEKGNVKHISGDLKPAKIAADAAKGDDSDSSDEDSDGNASSSDDEINGIGEEDSGDLSGDESAEFSESSDEELPEVQQSNKRPAETAPKTPAAKKPRQATPDKSGNKKGHNATPFPSKPNAGKKSNEQTLKSASSNKKGQFQNKFKRGGK